MNETILIVEDDKDILNLINDYLKSSGYNTLLATEGTQALDLYNDKKIDLMILDIMIPKIDGFELCRQIRKDSNIPIIILSAKKEESDKILGLGLGADDYMTKPFSPRELIARVKSQLRRFNELSNNVNSEILKFKDLEINELSRTVKLNGQDLAFSMKEFEILLFLASHPNQALSREKIFDNVWGYNNFGDINTVTVHVRKIREKIEQDPSNPDYIETVWGIGYKFIGE